jgi:hypothetical protein
MEQKTGASPENAVVPDRVKSSWHMLWAWETAFFAVSGGTALAGTLFDTRNEAP